jgi:hypothetical protein
LFQAGADVSTFSQLTKGGKLDLFPQELARAAECKSLVDFAPIKADELVWDSKIDTSAVMERFADGAPTAEALVRACFAFRQLLICRVQAGERASAGSSICQPAFAAS